MDALELLFFRPQHWTKKREKEKERKRKRKRADDHNYVKLITSHNEGRPYDIFITQIEDALGPVEVHSTPRTKDWTPGHSENIFLLYLLSSTVRR